jgi:hypothetical protein
MFPALIIEFVSAIISALPEIVVALVEGIVTEIILKLPEIIWEFIKEFVEALYLGIKEALTAVWDWFGGLFGGNKGDSGGSAYSGIDYVPAPMRVAVHPGEAIIPAHRNPAALGTGEPLAGGPSLLGQLAGAARGGMMSLEALFAVDGTVVDGVLVRAAKNGTAPQVQRMIRRASGTRVSFSRGHFNP